ncbi:Bro-N domain-containing protein [Escherichia albertii]|nr:Bro-N domain-containing protein [Escherichia albertii]
MKSLTKKAANYSTFAFDDKNVRVVAKDGEPWFLASDLCDVLGVDITSIRKLDDDEKGLHSMHTLGGSQQMAVVSESGMWTLILRCRDAVKPGTVPYRVRKWVTAEVLPSIRKHGEYVKGKKTTVEERTPLRDAVNMLVGKKGLRYDDAYNMVHQRFGIDSIDELSIEQIPLAVEYIHRVVLEGEFIGKQEELPAPKLDINFPISWFAENAPYAIIRQQCGDTVALDRSALVECSPAYKLIDILTKAGYDVSAVRAELKALRHLMAEQSWALKEIASFAAIRDRACHSIKL